MLIYKEFCNYLPKERKRVKAIVMFLLVLYGVIYIIRMILVKLYYKQISSYKNISDNNNDSANGCFTIIQPIVSGDITLKNTLKANVLKAKQINFIWIVDEDDEEAKILTKQISEETKADITIIIAPKPSSNVNQKVYKQHLALHYAREYFIALDDDTMIDFDKLYNIKSMLDAENCVVTGLPYYRLGNDALTNLTAGFVNGNTLGTYIVMAKLGASHTLNGMCYFAKKEMFEALDIYLTVMNKLADEYEIAKILEANNISIHQSIIPCNVGTKIEGLKHYVCLMKRWMVFANIYICEKIDIATFSLIILPGILPLVIFLLAAIVNYKYIIVYSLELLVICILNFFFRETHLSSKHHMEIIIYEWFAYFLQPLHYVNSLIKGREIIWRKNRVTLLKNGQVIYKKIEK